MGSLISSLASLRGFYVTLNALHKLQRQEQKMLTELESNSPHRKYHYYMYAKQKLLGLVVSST